MDVGLQVDVAGDAGSCGEDRDGGHPRQKTESQHPLLLTPLVTLGSTDRVETEANVPPFVAVGVDGGMVLMA